MTLRSEYRSKRVLNIFIVSVVLTSVAASPDEDRSAKDQAISSTDEMPPLTVVVEEPRYDRLSSAGGTRNPDQLWVGPLNATAAADPTTAKLAADHRDVIDTALLSSSVACSPPCGSSDETTASRPRSTARTTELDADAESSETVRRSTAQPPNQSSSRIDVVDGPSRTALPRHTAHSVDSSAPIARVPLYELPVNDSIADSVIADLGISSDVSQFAETDNSSISPETTTTTTTLLQRTRSRRSNTREMTVPSPAKAASSSTSFGASMGTNMEVSIRVVSPDQLTHVDGQAPTTRLVSDADAMEYVTTPHLSSSTRPVHVARAVDSPQRAAADATNETSDSGVVSPDIGIEPINRIITDAVQSPSVGVFGEKERSTDATSSPGLLRATGSTLVVAVRPWSFDTTKTETSSHGNEASVGGRSSSAGDETETMERDSAETRRGLAATDVYTSSYFDKARLSTSFKATDALVQVETRLSAVMRGESTDALPETTLSLGARSTSQLSMYGSCGSKSSSLSPAAFNVASSAEAALPTEPLVATPVSLKAAAGSSAGSYAAANETDRPSVSSSALFETVSSARSSTRAASASHALITKSDWWPSGTNETRYDVDSASQTEHRSTDSTPQRTTSATGTAARSIGVTEADGLFMKPPPDQPETNKLLPAHLAPLSGFGLSRDNMTSSDPVHVSVSYEVSFRSPSLTFTRALSDTNSSWYLALSSVIGLEVTTSLTEVRPLSDNLQLIGDCIFRPGRPGSIVVFLVLAFRRQIDAETLKIALGRALDNLPISADKATLSVTVVDSFQNAELTTTTSLLDAYSPSLLLTPIWLLVVLVSCMLVVIICTAIRAIAHFRSSSPRRVSKLRRAVLTTPIERPARSSASSTEGVDYRSLLQGCNTGRPTFQTVAIPGRLWRTVKSMTPSPRLRRVTTDELMDTYGDHRRAAALNQFVGQREPHPWPPLDRSDVQLRWWRWLRNNRAIGYSRGNDERPVARQEP